MRLADEQPDDRGLSRGFAARDLPTAPRVAWAFCAQAMMEEQNRSDSRGDQKKIDSSGMRSGLVRDARL